MSDLCGLSSGELSLQLRKQFHKDLYSSLYRVSQFLEGPQFKLNSGAESELDKVLPPRWNTMSSILYALSILASFYLNNESGWIVNGQSNGNLRMGICNLFELNY